MVLRIIVPVIVFAVAFAPRAGAETTDCTTPVLIITDGRITQSTFPAMTPGNATTFWFGIYAQAGHSYSVEFVPQADNYSNTTRVQFTTLGVFGPGDTLQACHGTSSVTVTQNSGYAPVILKNGNGAGRRVSFTARSAGLHLISATDVAGAGSYTFRALDTTLFNPRWSTWGGNDDQWGLMNLSEMPITGIFTVYDLNSRVLASVQFTIAAGGEVVRYSNASDLNLPRDASGYVIFSHNGPPNSILADAYMLNSTATVVVPKKFEPFSTH